MGFDEVIIWLMTVGLLIGGIDRIIGNKFGLGEQFEEGFNAMGPLALGMVGIMILTPVISRLLDAFRAVGLVITLANSIPVYKLIKQKTPGSKVINTAWLVSATATLGDHLGFTAGVRPDMITPVVLCKLIAGVLAISLAVLCF